MSHRSHFEPQSFGRGADRAAARALERHFERKPKCERRGGDVCCYPWLGGLFVFRYCTACNGSIRWRPEYGA